MAEPLAPEGYIRLKDAYDKFQFGMYGETPSLANGYNAEHAALSKRIDSANATFTANLNQLAYGGKVISQDGKIHEISSNMFDRTKLADLLPLHNAIPVGISGPLLNYAGGIICLNSDVFFGWLLKELSIHLHREIQQGRLLPNQANKRLAEINLPALDGMPPLEGFREVVQKEPYWTLPMSVAWIAWRNIDDVVKQYWPYAKHGGHWRESRGPSQIQTGMNWESAEERTLSGLMVSEAVETYSDNPPSKFIKDSREELWRALQAGELTAIGIEGQGSHKKIASERWASLAIQPQLRGREFVGAGILGDAEKIYDVKLLSNDMRRIWKPESSEAIVIPLSEISSVTDTVGESTKAKSDLPILPESEIETLYIARRDSWPTDAKSPSRDDDIAWAKTISGQVTNKITRFIRNKHAPESWTSQGRRRQSN